MKKNVKSIIDYFKHFQEVKVVRTHDWKIQRQLIWKIGPIQPKIYHRRPWCTEWIWILSETTTAKNPNSEIIKMCYECSHSLLLLLDPIVQYFIRIRMANTDHWIQFFAQWLLQRINNIPWLAANSIYAGESLTVLTYHRIRGKINWIKR